MLWFERKTCGRKEKTSYFSTLNPFSPAFSNKGPCIFILHGTPYIMKLALTWRDHFDSDSGVHVWQVRADTHNWRGCPSILIFFFLRPWDLCTALLPNFAAYRTKLKLEGHIWYSWIEVVRKVNKHFTKICSALSPWEKDSFITPAKWGANSEV